MQPRLAPDRRRDENKEGRGPADPWVATFRKWLKECNYSSRTESRLWEATRPNGLLNVSNLLEWAEAALLSQLPSYNSCGPGFVEAARARLILERISAPSAFHL